MQRIAKIRSLENRLADYNQERFQFLTQELPMIVMVVMLACGSILYGLHHWNFVSGNWQLMALALTICLSMPPALLLYPKRPTDADVLQDQELRRSFGMDDSVDE